MTTTTLEQLIIADRQAGMTCHQIAAARHKCARAVRKILAENWTVLRGNRSSEGLEQAIIAGYRARVQAWQLALDYGTTTATIYDVLNRNGVELHGRAKTEQERKLEKWRAGSFVNKLQNGCSFETAARLAWPQMPDDERTELARAVEQQARLVMELNT
jgi:hypothetical protein